MPNLESAKKRVRSSARKAKVNKANKLKLKSAMKKALCDGSTKSDKLAAIVALDRAVSKGIIHKNNASRKKSRIALQINNLS